MDLYEDLSGSELLAAAKIYYDYFSGRPFKTPEQFNVRVFVKKLRNKYPSIVRCPPLSSTSSTTTQAENTKHSSSPMLLRL